MTIRTPEQHCALVQEIRTMLADPTKLRCSCPKTACEWHGRCRECIAIHRHYRDHVPNCLQEFMRDRIAAVAGLVEMTVADKPRTPASLWAHVRQRDQETGTSQNGAQT
jgi:hypothetical protein